MKENSKQLAALVRAARGGDESAFARLYRATRDRAYFVALSITKNEDDALDILQDAYLKAWQRLSSLEDPGQFSAWFRAITGNTAKDYLRKQNPLLFMPLNEEEGGPLDWLEEQREDCLPAKSMDTAETRRLVLDIVQKLPEDQRLCVLMRYYEDLPVADIAAALELPQGTVKSRLWYARQSISEGVRRLEKQGVKLYATAPLPIVVWVLRHLRAPATRHLPRLILGSGAGTAAAGGAVAGGTAAGTGAAGSIAAGIALPKVIAGVATVVIAAGGAVTAAKILPSRQEPGETAISAIDVTAETGTTEAFSAVVFPFSLPPLPEVSENKTYASRQRLFDAPETRPAGLNATAPAHTSSQAAASAESATTTSAAVNTTSRAATTAATVSSAQTTTTTTTAVKTTTAAAGSLIPDPGLEAAIRFELVKQTGELTKSDLAKVKQLFIRPGSDLRSFEGIRNCTSLENLVVDASGGARPALDTMDLSGMVALKEISLFGISLKQLNVSGCTSLTGLSCAELGLQTIEVRGCTALETLLCGQNNLASLDISGCTGLTMMNCSMNKIASLDVRGLMRLRQLVCFQNSFPSRSAIIGLDQLPGLTLLVFDPQN